MPRPSSCTTWAYTRACWPNQTAYSPEPELPRPPPDHHCRARLSADSPSPGTHLAPPLGHMEATRATHCWAPPLSSPPSEPPRPRRFCSAAAARRPGRTSTTNRSRVRPIALPARLFASPCLTLPPASAPPPSGYGGGKPRAQLWTFKNSRGLCAKIFYPLLYVLAETCKIDIKL
jgi:hypothetical protein